MRRIPASELITGDSVFVWWNSTTREKTDRNKQYRPYDTVNAILPYPKHSKNADIMIGIIEFVSGARMSLEKNDIFDLLTHPEDYRTNY